jgi:hypothetical protein
MTLDTPGGRPPAASSTATGGPGTGLGSSVASEPRQLFHATGAVVRQLIPEPLAEETRAFMRGWVESWGRVAQSDCGPSVVWGAVPQCTQHKGCGGAWEVELCVGGGGS